MFAMSVFISGGGVGAAALVGVRKDFFYLYQTRLMLCDNWSFCATLMTIQWMVLMLVALKTNNEIQANKKQREMGRDTTKHTHTRTLCVCVRDP